uniref:CSON009310 protein n=1 Tax=Culicoides sonorensis TaxID=179676 RepID=A0A336MYC7_CULSO
MSSEEKEKEISSTSTEQIEDKSQDKEEEKMEVDENKSETKIEPDSNEEKRSEKDDEEEEEENKMNVMECSSKNEVKPNEIESESPAKECEENKETKDEMETDAKGNEVTEEAENTETDNEEEPDMKTMYPENYQNVASGSRRLRINFRPVSDENESDNEYKSDDNEIKKTIMVGSDYQAQIPEEFSKYDDALPYENKDKLVWDGCDKLSEDEILDYLKKVRVISHPTSGTSDSITQQLLAIPTGKHLRDDEQALFLLQQCGHDIEEALRRRKIAAAPPEEVMSAWSEEECRNFETGLRLYGKNFHQIQLSKVKTRSVGEIVQFYYLWKKSERHDVFASKARLDKKKYSLNPGQCIMDRFLEEQDGTGISNDANNDVQQNIPRNLSMPMCV